ADLGGPGDLQLRHFRVGGPQVEPEAPPGDGHSTGRRRLEEVTATHLHGQAPFPREPARSGSEGSTISPDSCSVPGSPLGAAANGAERASSARTGRGAWPKACSHNETMPPGSEPGRRLRGRGEQKS